MAHVINRRPMDDVSDDENNKPPPKPKRQISILQKAMVERVASVQSVSMYDMDDEAKKELVQLCLKKLEFKFPTKVYDIIHNIAETEFDSVEFWDDIYEADGDWEASHIMQEVLEKHDDEEQCESLFKFMLNVLCGDDQHDPDRNIKLPREIVWSHANDEDAIKEAQVFLNNQCPDSGFPHTVSNMDLLKAFAVSQRNQVPMMSIFMEMFELSKISHMIKPNDSTFDVQSKVKWETWMKQCKWPRNFNSADDDVDGCEILTKAIGDFKRSLSGTTFGDLFSHRIEDDINVYIDYILRINETISNLNNEEVYPLQIDVVIIGKDSNEVETDYEAMDNQIKWQKDKINQKDRKIQELTKNIDGYKQITQWLKEQMKVESTDSDKPKLNMEQLQKWCDLMIAMDPDEEEKQETEEEQDASTDKADDKEDAAEEPKEEEPAKETEEEEAEEEEKSQEVAANVDDDDIVSALLYEDSSLVHNYQAINCLPRGGMKKFLQFKGIKLAKYKISSTDTNVNGVIRDGIIKQIGKQSHQRVIVVIDRSFKRWNNCNDNEDMLYIFQLPKYDKIRADYNGSDEHMSWMTKRYLFPNWSGGREDSKGVLKYVGGCQDFGNNAFVFSFHVHNRNKVKCELFIKRHKLPFLPHHIVDVWPIYFAPKFRKVDEKYSKEYIYEHWKVQTKDEMLIKWIEWVDKVYYKYLEKEHLEYEK